MTALLLALTAAADPGGEIAIVLDNSTSMIAGSDLDGRQLPPNDPQRIAVLGALVVEGLARGSRDAVTVYGFDTPSTVRTAADQASIRNLEYVPTTLFKPALSAADSLFAGSRRDRKVLVLLTDGSPNDVARPDELPALFAQDPETIAIGFYRDPDARAHGETYLRALVDDPADLHGVDPAAPDVVGRTLGAFTTSYARLLGSRPETGSLRAGQSHAFTAGRYVTEVLVAVASRDPGPALQVGLAGPKGAVPPSATGDNGCAHRTIWEKAEAVCQPPRRHYAVFRAPHDPSSTARFELSVPSSGSAAEFGVILRYELDAELTVPPRVRVGDVVPVSARLRFRGETANDPALTGAPGFRARVRLGADEVVLTPAGDGTFTGTWTPTAAGGLVAEAAFRSDWLDVRGRAQVVVGDFVPLALNLPPVELGSWAGGRGRTRQCAILDLAQSPGADQVPIRCAPSPLTDVALTCAPVAGSEATLPDGSRGRPMRWEVCAEAAGCCGALPVGGESASLAVQGDHAHYDAGAATVPVRLEVAPTGFLRCWWMELAAVAGALFAAWFAAGWLRPFAFDPSMCVRVASKEANLKRATALVLAETPGGRRGFYRSATFALTADGHPTRKVASALLAVRAGPRGRMTFLKSSGLERQDRRTKAWAPVEGAAEVETGTLYRAGGLVLKFG